MGTSNFHTANAQATYVIDYGEDQDLWDECQEYIGNWLQEVDSNFEPDDSLNSNEELRSFPSSSIGSIDWELNYLNLNFTYCINIFIRSGYYEAANLDYEFEWLIDGCDYYENTTDVISKLEEDLEYYDIKPGIWALHGSRLQTKLESIESEAIQHIESLLTQVSTPYGVTGHFSNGETIYHKLGD